MRIFRGFTALSSVALVAWASAARADGRSVRETDVGGIKLGMTLAQVRAALPKEMRLDPTKSMDSDETAVVSAYKAHLRIAFFGGPTLVNPGYVISISKDGPQTTCEAIVKAVVEKYGTPYPVKMPLPGAKDPVKTTVYGWFEEKTTPAGRIPVVKCLQEYGAGLGDRDALSVILMERSVEPTLCTYHINLHGGAYRAEVEKRVKADAEVRQKQKFEELKKKADSEKPSL